MPIMTHFSKRDERVFVVAMTEVSMVSNSCASSAPEGISGSMSLMTR